MNKNNCPHNPSSKNSYLSRFADFFLHKKKLCYCVDDSGRCAVCNEPLLAPKAYYHPMLKIIYILATVAVFFLLYIVVPNIAFDRFLLFIITSVLCCAALLLFDRAVTAAIFATHSWLPCESESSDIDHLSNLAATNRNEKCLAVVLYGRIAFQILAQYTYMSVFPACVALICLITALVKKRYLQAIIGAAVFIYSSVSFYFHIANGGFITPIIDKTLLFILFLVVQYVMFQLLDKERIPQNTI